MSPHDASFGSPGRAIVDVRHSSSPVSGSCPVNEAGLRLVALAPVGAGDDDAVGDDGAGVLAEALRVVVLDRPPRHLAGPRVEGDEGRVRGGEEHPVAVEGQGAGRRPLRRILGQRRSVLPDDVAGDRVQRLHDVPRAGQKHHAVVHQRRRLVVPLADREHPGEPQLVDVAARHVVERTVAVAVARPAPAQPVAGRRVREQRVGHRGQIVRHLPVDEPRRPPPRPVALPRRAPRLGHVRRVADHDRRVRRQGRVAGPGAVHVQDVRDQVQIHLIAERSPQARRHLVAHIREQLVRRLPRPAVQEVDPAQRRRFRPVQPRPVALAALPRVHRPPGRRLFRRVAPLDRRGLRRRDADARPAGRAARRDQSGRRHQRGGSPRRSTDFEVSSRRHDSQLLGAATAPCAARSPVPPLYHGRGDT